MRRARRARRALAGDSERALFPPRSARRSAALASRPVRARARRRLPTTFRSPAITWSPVEDARGPSRAPEIAAAVIRSTASIVAGRRPTPSQAGAEIQSVVARRAPCWPQLAPTRRLRAQVHRAGRRGRPADLESARRGAVARDDRRAPASRARAAPSAVPIALAERGARRVGVCEAECGSTGGAALDGRFGEAPSRRCSARDTRGARRSAESAARSSQAACACGERRGVEQAKPAADRRARRGRERREPSHMRRPRRAGAPRRGADASAASRGCPVLTRRRSASTRAGSLDAEEARGGDALARSPDPGRAARAPTRRTPASVARRRRRSRAAAARLGGAVPRGERTPRRRRRRAGDDRRRPCGAAPPCRRRAHDADRAARWPNAAAVFQKRSA